MTRAEITAAREFAARARLDVEQVHGECKAIHARGERLSPAQSTALDLASCTLTVADAVLAGLNAGRMHLVGNA
jgi:hypothetical protein